MIDMTSFDWWSQPVQEGGKGPARCNHCLSSMWSVAMADAGVVELLPLLLFAPPPPPPLFLLAIGVSQQKSSNLWRQLAHSKATRRLSPQVTISGLLLHVCPICARHSVRTWRAINSPNATNSQANQEPREADERTFCLCCTWPGRSLEHDDHSQLASAERVLMVTVLLMMAIMVMMMLF